MGLTPTTKVLSPKVVTPSTFARERLGLEKGDKLIRLERLRLAEDVPMMLETRYIRTDLCPNIEQEELSSSLWRVFDEKYGLKPNRHSQGMMIVTLSGHAAALLTLNDNSVVFLIKGVTYVKKNEPIECEESLYRSDKYELTFDATID